MIKPAFDPVIHPYQRLRICAMLSSVESMAFSEVRDSLGVSDSVLSKHVKALQDAGWVQLHREKHGPRRRAWLSLTGPGRDALAAHLAQLREIAENAGNTG